MLCFPLRGLSPIVPFEGFVITFDEQLEGKRTKCLTPQKTLVLSQVEDAQRLIPLKQIVDGGSHPMKTISQSDWSSPIWVCITSRIGRPQVERWEKQQQRKSSMLEGLPPCKKYKPILRGRMYLPYLPHYHLFGFPNVCLSDVKPSPTDDVTVPNRMRETATG